jgi:hypothetical protein
MKQTVFILYFFTLLLAGGNKMQANMHKNIFVSISISNWTLLSKEQDQITILDHSYSLIEYSDFDLDEEFSHCDNHEDSKTNKLFQVKHSLLDNLSFGDSLDNTYYYNVFYNCEPITGQSTPIYITHNVLRI